MDVQDVLNAYVNGVFPMYDSESNEILWYSPDPRAIIPIETYYTPRSLRSIINKEVFTLKVNHNFKNVIEACSKPRSEDDGIWISEEIINIYCQLHELGWAHSVEAYNKEGNLAGGLYGVSIGSVFFGESMFHFESNASKVAFDFLIKRLKERSFDILDTQFLNDNVLRYGAIEVKRPFFLEKLGKALLKKNSFV